MASTGKKVGMFIFGSAFGLILSGGITYGLYVHAQNQDSASPNPSTETSATTAETPPAEENVRSGEATPANDGNACTRAASCCIAYVESVASMMPTVNAETTCAGVQASAQAGPAGFSACESMISTWRTSLLSINKPIPANCQ